MRILLNIVGAVLAFCGSVWALQGMSLLPGKLMRGQPQWILYGALTLAARVALLVGANRRRRSPG